LEGWICSERITRRANDKFDCFRRHLETRWNRFEFICALSAKLVKVDQSDKEF
jgi:hypothetical protein